MLLAALLRYLVGLLFLITGGAKLLKWKGFVGIVQAYRVLPKRLATLFGLLLPFVELALGVCLFSRRLAPWPELLAAVVLFGFTVVIIGALLSGKQGLQCGCCPGIARKKMLLNYGAALTNIVLIGICLVASGLPPVTPYEGRLTLVLAAIWIGGRAAPKLVRRSEARGPQPAVDSMT